MSAPRPAERAPSELRRTVDEDGVVKVELRGGGGAVGARLIAGAAIVALAGGLAWLGLKGAPGREAPSGVESSGHAQAPGPRRTNTNTTANSNKRPNSRRTLPSPAGDSDRSPESGRARGPADQPEGPGSPESAAEAREEASEGAARAPDFEFNAPRPGEIPERGGIGSFPAPGTKRIKSGIVVPEDFPLPPGYVRHFQTTDRGQMLQGILMFHPDYQPLDADGKPIPIPADRVVPEELAPPGLKVEYLDVPDDAYANSEGSDEGGEPEKGGGDGAP
jgi:hypothetical protein